MEQVVGSIKKCIADKESTLANLELINSVDDQALLKDFVLKGGAEVTVEVIEKYPDDPGVLDCVFPLLSKLAHLPEADKQVNTKRAIFATLIALKKCQNSHGPLSFLSVAVRSIDEGLWSEIGNCMDAISRIMDKNKNDIKVQKYGMQLLALLYLNTHGDSTDPKGEGIRLAINVIKTFPDDASIQRYGLGVIGLMQLGSKEQQEYVTQFCGLEAIVSSMKQCKDNPTIQGWGCYALGTACFGNKKNQNITQKLGGVACVVDALKKFKDDEDVQEWGIKTLAFLAHDNLDVQIELYANGIEASLETMKSHPTFAGVQRWGNNLVSCLSSSDQTLFRDKIVALGGVDVVFDGIRQFKDDEGVQKSGINALGLLASKKCKDVQSHIAIDRKGFDDIVYTMLNYELDESIQLTCCCAIKEITAGNAEVLEAFGNTFNGVESVMSAIVSFEDRVELQREAWCAVANISENIECLGKFLTYDGIEIVHNIMKTYSTDDSIQRSCLTILLNIGTLALNN